MTKGTKAKHGCLFCDFSIDYGVVFRSICLDHTVSTLNILMQFYRMILNNKKVPHR
jgi:hypothetical protein